MPIVVVCAEVKADVGWLCLCSHSFGMSVARLVWQHFETSWCFLLIRRQSLCQETEQEKKNHGTVKRTDLKSNVLFHIHTYCICLLCSLHSPGDWVNSSEWQADPAAVDGWVDTLRWDQWPGGGGEAGYGEPCPPLTGWPRGPGCWPQSCCLCWRSAQLGRPSPPPRGRRPLWNLKVSSKRTTTGAEMWGDSLLLGLFLAGKCKSTGWSNLTWGFGVMFTKFPALHNQDISTNSFSFFNFETFNRGKCNFEISNKNSNINLNKQTKEKSSNQSIFVYAQHKVCDFHISFWISLSVVFECHRSRFVVCEGRWREVGHCL